MNEAFLQYVWKSVNFPKSNLTSDTGEKVKIIDVGTLNTNQGPDFSNAKVELNGQLWAGNVEIHTKSSLWFQHGHNRDVNYDNVILHVVAEHDKAVLNTKGRHVPTIVLPYHGPMEEKYHQLMQQQTAIPCQEELPTLDTFRTRFWLESLLIERTEGKTALINAYLAATNNNWNEAFYISMCRYFGMKVNAEPFERLARSLPLKIIQKHQGSVFQLEALLFGQSGLLPEKPLDDYSQQLKKEYAYLKNKYKLTNLPGNVWRFHRLRPSNFPTIRISQLAVLLAGNLFLFDQIRNAEGVNEIKKLFRAETSLYWKSHFQFNEAVEMQEKKMGTLFVQTLIVNAVVPFLFVYHKAKGKHGQAENDLRYLEDLPSEKNAVISLWEKSGIKSLNSAMSQSLLQLKEKYCDKKRCIDCQLGHMILSKG